MKFLQMLEPTWILMPNKTEKSGYRDPDIANRSQTKPLPSKPLEVEFLAVLVVILAVLLSDTLAGILKIGKLFYRVSIDEIVYQKRQMSRKFYQAGTFLIRTNQLCYLGG